MKPANIYDKYNKDMNDRLRREQMDAADTIDASLHDELELRPGEFKLLRDRYDEAVALGRDDFKFKGHLFVTDYAKYLIEHLTNLGIED